MLVLASSLLGCGNSTGADTTPSDSSLDTCTGGPAVVTDIDETLTTLDSEWVAELVDASHDPAMRPDANTLMQGLADLGFAIFYVTARGDDPVLSDGRTATEATEDWLVDHGFPYEPGSGRLTLSDGIGLAGDPAADYKAEILKGLQDEGFTFDLGYGNAESDIDGYRAAGMPDEDLYLVGSLAGTMGVTGIPDEDAYTAYTASFLPTVQAPEGGCP